MSDKKIRTYRVEVQGADSAKQKVRELSDELDRARSKAEALSKANQIAKMFQGSTRMTKDATLAVNENTRAVEANERAQRRLTSQRTMGAMSNLRTNDPGALWRGAEIVGATSIVYPSQLPYAQRMLQQAGRMAPISRGDIENRSLAAAIGIPFNRFLPALLKGVNDISQLDKKLEQALSRVTSTSAGRSYGLNLARNYVTGFGMQHYGQLRLRNPSGLSNYEMAFLSDMNRSPYPLSASDLAFGHAGRGPIQSAMPASGVQQDEVQLWQRASRVLQGMRSKHLTMRMVAQRELHPISALMLPSQQIEAALAQSAYRPNVLSPYGRQVAGYAGLNQIPGWRAMPSAIPHMTAEGVGLNLQDVPISWVPKKKDIRVGGPTDKNYQYVTWKSQSGISLLPWNNALSGTANRFMSGGPVFSSPFQEQLSGILGSAQRPGRKSLSYHDLSNSSVSFTQWLNAISNPDYLYSNPFTTEESLVRSYMPNRGMFASGGRGNLAYGQYMQDFFTNPRLFKSLGTPGQAAEYAGVLGRYIPQAHGAGASHDQVNSLTNSLVELMDFAFPGLTHNALGRSQEDAKAFERVIGGPDFVDALAKTIGEAYRRAITSADVRMELRYNPEDRMPMMAGGMNIVPHMLRAFDMMLSGTSGRYSPEGLAARSMKHQGMSSRAMNQLLGISGEDEGDIVRTHRVPIPKLNIPLSKETPFRYMDYSKGAITNSRWELARHIKEATGSSESIGDIMLSIARTGVGSNLAGMLSREVEARNAEMSELTLFPSDIESIYSSQTPEEYEHSARTGATGAPLSYGMSSPVTPTNITGSSTTGGKRRPKVPKRMGVLNKAFQMLNQETLKQILPFGLAAGIGLVAEHFMPGAGSMMGGMAMMGVTSRGNWDEWIANYSKENPIPDSPNDKANYYEEARAMFSGPGGGSADTIKEAAKVLAGGSGLGGAGASNAKAKSIRMTDVYKDLQSMMSSTTPGATGAKFSVEMQYPISEESSSQRQKIDTKMTETLDKISKLGLEAKIGSKAEMAAYGGRPYSNKFAVAGGKIDYSNPEESQQMLGNLAQVISESGAENIFFTKSETNRQSTGIMSAISTMIGKSPGTSGEGLGKMNVMSIRGKFAFTPEQTDQMKNVREQLQGMGKDIQITTYRTSELDDANQRVYKDYLEIDQNIPLDKTNQYGQTIEDTVAGFGNQANGIEGSIKAMKSYDESMENSTTWTDKLISKGKDVNKFSWQLTMLSLGALGVYFSMMGIVGLIKQGASAVIGPLQDLEGMIKNSILADVFGFGSTGTLAEKIAAALNAQGGTASFTDLFTALGTSIFGDPEVMASIRDTFTTLQTFFDNPENKETVKNIFKGIAESVQTIVDNAGPVLKVLEAGVTPLKKYPVIGPVAEGAGVGEQSALSAGILLSTAALATMGVGSALSWGTSIGGKAMMWGGKGLQYGQKGFTGLKGLFGKGGIGDIPTEYETGELEAALNAGKTTAKDSGGWMSKISGMFGKGGGGVASIGLQAATGMTATTLLPQAYDYYLFLKNPEEWWKNQGSMYSTIANAVGGNVTAEQSTSMLKEYQSKYGGGEPTTGLIDTSSPVYEFLQQLGGLFGLGSTPTGTDQTDTIAKKIAAEVPVSQAITVTFIIQGNMDKAAGETSVLSLAEFLKAYAKGNTPGGTS